MPDYTVEDTVYKRFTTRAFATGIPTTLSGTPVVSAYEDNSAVQITAGITLGVDHDSVLGLNLLTIVATAANGFEAGKSYDLVITTGTVGGVSVVGEVVWHFTLSAEAAAVDLANGTDGLGAIKGDTAAILVDTGTTLDGKINTIDTNVDAILVDTGTTIPATIATVDTNVDAILVDTGTTIPATIATVDANVDSILVDTADMQPKLGAPAGASMSADIAAIKAETALIVADTNELQTDDVPGLIAALNDLAASDILTTALTEAYAADGSAFTLSEALYMIYSVVAQSAVAATAITTKKLDGTTTAMTFTTDDATDPTSRTRTG